MPTPGKRKVPAPAPPRRPPPRMEYRAKDGAWYGARLALQDDLLRVMFEEFPEESDEWHDPNAADLASPRDVAALRARFRPASPPLQDARCGDLRRGQPLCVLRATSDGERKFYDAVLDSMKRSAHVTVGGEERCACRFKVQWTDGPLRGGWEEVGVDEVCCVKGSPVHDPTLSEFLDRVTRSFGFSDGEEKAKAVQDSPVQDPRLNEFLYGVTNSFGFCNGEEKPKAAPQGTVATSPPGGEGNTTAVQDSPAQDPRLNEFLDRVTNSFGFCNGEEKPKPVTQGTGATSPPGGEGNATAAPQATGATSPPGGEGKPAYIIID